jgi:N-acetyl-beta-hexosaminidase
MDAMVMSKLNVLHMHITDDQSFPIESKAYPKLAGAGSYGEGYTYSADDISDLVDYATARGILLVPEFDMVCLTSSPPVHPTNFSTDVCIALYVPLPTDFRPARPLV